jgi:hypothetical protein
VASKQRGFGPFSKGVEMSTQFTFGYEDNWEGDIREVSMSLNGPLSWMEVTEFYFRYLRACGFVFNKDDVKEYLGDYALQHVEAEDDSDAA